MDVYEFSAKRLGGEEESLDGYRGKVLLIVNTASKCGFTPQFEGLEQLYRDYHDQGFDILGFPCNQFAHQDPGDAATIANFCQKNYGVSFPMFEKVCVNGDATIPLYGYLKMAAPGLLGSGAIKWNFTKFLVGRDGQVVARFGSKDKPESLRGPIEKQLAAD